MLPLVAGLFLSVEFNMLRLSRQGILLIIWIMVYFTVFIGKCPRTLNSKIFSYYFLGQMMFFEKFKLAEIAELQMCIKGQKFEMGRKEQQEKQRLFLFSIFNTFHHNCQFPI
jgi:hypothetical protein